MGKRNFINWKENSLIFGGDTLNVYHILTGEEKLKCELEDGLYYFFSSNELGYYFFNRYRDDLLGKIGRDEKRIVWQFDFLKYLEKGTKIHEKIFLNNGEILIRYSGNRKKLLW